MTTAVEEFFDPEFFNRIDEMVILKPFESDTARAVTERELGLLTARLAREAVDLRVDGTVVDFLQGCGFDPAYGARGLRRTLRHHLMAPVAECVLAGRCSSADPITVEVSLSGDALRARRVPQGFRP